MPQNLSNIPLIIKIFAVIIGAIFALTLSGDIDKDGKLKLSFGVAVKFAFSAYFGLAGGAFIIEHQSWQLSVMSQSFISMIVSVFGMLAVGIIYQSIKMMEGKTLHEIITEIKTAFKAIFK